MSGLTTVPAVKRELASRLSEALEDLKVPVYRGMPDRLAGESYAVVAKARAEQEYAALGGSRRRDETYRVGVVFQASDVLDGIEETSERAYTMLARLAELLETDPTLGGLVIVAELEEWEDDELPTDKAGVVVLIGATVRVKARTRGVSA